jgi:hypothetical protein
VTRDEANILRDTWVSEGNISGDHVALRLEQTVTGYLTGAYLCIRCGHEVGIKELD